MVNRDSKLLGSVKKLSEELKVGGITPTEILEISLEKIKRLNPMLNAFITIIKEQSYNDARIAEKEIKEGRYLGPLHGIPYSVKDILYVKDIRCTAGSKSHNFVPTTDATCIK